MRIVTGKVVDGKVVVDDEALEEGSSVIVFAPDSDLPFHLREDERRELLERIAEVERGDTADFDEFLRTLLPRSP